jgi:hypothetical protein
MEGMKEVSFPESLKEQTILTITLTPTTEEGLVKTNSAIRNSSSPR